MSKTIAPLLFHSTTLKSCATALFSLFLLSSCTSSPTPAVNILHVQYTVAARPWLSDLADCAGETALDLQQRPLDLLDLSSADLGLRLGDQNLTAPAYQIASEDILVIVHPQNPAAPLSADEVRRLFTGTITNWEQVGGENAPAEVWVFAAGEDIQQIFETAVLNGAPVTSTARLATSPEAMIQAVADNVHAIGLLTRRLKTDEVAEAFVAATVPVLITFPAEPARELANLTACLQK